MSRIYLNNDWWFTETFTEEFLAEGEHAAGVQKVRLPHTCKELPYHYFDEQEYQMVCGYQKVIEVPKEWESKAVLLTVDGAAHYAQVYINGVKCSEHYSGYTAFTTDISGQLRFGESNVITIQLDTRESLNIPPFGFVVDYMTYGGIYRDVYLDIKETAYVADVFVKPDISGTVISEVTLNCIPEGNAVVRQFACRNQERVCLAECRADNNHLTLKGTVENVKLWDVEQPELYTIETELVLGDNILDVHKTTVGFRSAEFRKDGFYLNGRKVKIHGLNRHQSYPYVGYAMPESMQRFDADVLKKELGCNAVRTSHYPQSHYFLDQCDRIGLLVFTEIPGWQHIGDEAWKEQAVRNVKEMIEQYRNHPSIILWGVRINESADDEAFYTKTNALAHELDPTRQTGGVRCIKKSQLLEDVYTYNEFVHNGITPGCEPKNKIIPDAEKPYLISEYNGHMFPTKMFDSERHRVEHALRHARVLDSVASYGDICGSFGWCMADYNTHKDFGSGDRICYHGVLDMFRNHKPATAVYACLQEKEVVLEVASGMDIGEQPASSRGEVWIFTNADSVRMYKNGKFIKEYVPENRRFAHLKNSPILIDDYIGKSLIENEKYPKKQAEVITKALNHIALYGYSKLPLPMIWAAFRCFVLYHMSIDEVMSLYTRYVGDWGGTATEYRFEAVRDGKVVKTVIKTPMKKAGLKVSVSSDQLSERQSYDVAAVRIQAVDEHGNQLYFCGEPVQLRTEGPIEIIGPGTVSLMGGAVGTYVKSTGTEGKAALVLSNPQLGEQKIHFTVKINQ